MSESHVVTLLRHGLIMRETHYGRVDGRALPMTYCWLTDEGRRVLEAHPDGLGDGSGYLPG